MGHDYSHAERVVKNARYIGKELGFHDVELLEVCGWWHDVGRLYNPDHEKLSAKLMADDLKSRGVDFKTRREAYKAVYKHRYDMNPKTVAGKIIKDADKLDFISVERWNKRESAGQHNNNLRNLAMLPNIRRSFYFEATRLIFDRRLNRFAENLEHQGTLVTKTLVLQPA